MPFLSSPTDPSEFSSICETGDFAFCLFGPLWHPLQICCRQVSPVIQDTENHFPNTTFSLQMCEYNFYWSTHDLSMSMGALILGQMIVNHQGLEVLQNPMWWAMKDSWYQLRTAGRTQNKSLRDKTWALVYWNPHSTNCVSTFQPGQTQEDRGKKALKQKSRISMSFYHKM